MGYQGWEDHDDGSEENALEIGCDYQRGVEGSLPQPLTARIQARARPGVQE